MMRDTFSNFLLITFLFYCLKWTRYCGISFFKKLNYKKNYYAKREKKKISKKKFQNILDPLFSFLFLFIKRKKKEPTTTSIIINMTRSREDTAKYLLNLSLDSPYYDPKSRSMRQSVLSFFSFSLSFLFSFSFLHA